MIVTNIQQLPVEKMGERGVKYIETLLSQFFYKAETTQKIKYIFLNLKLKITYCIRINLTMELLGSNTDALFFGKFSFSCIVVFHLSLKFKTIIYDKLAYAREENPRFPHLC